MRRRRLWDCSVSLWLVPARPRLQSAMVTVTLSLGMRLLCCFHCVITVCTKCNGIYIFHGCRYGRTAGWSMPVGLMTDAAVVSHASLILSPKTATVA